MDLSASSGPTSAATHTLPARYDHDAFMRLSTMQQAEELTSKAIGPGNLARLAHQIVHLCQERGISAVVGASPPGDALAGAVAGLAPEVVHLQPGPGEPVLVVDPVLVSGIQVMKKRRQLMARGHKQVAIAVVHDLGGISASIEKLPEPIVVLDAS